MRVFEDPSGRFYVQVPAHWTEAEPDPSASEVFKAHDPEGSVVVVVQVVEGVFVPALDYTEVLRSEFLEGTLGYRRRSTTQTEQGLPAVILKTAIDDETLTAQTYVSEDGMAINISYFSLAEPVGAERELFEYSSSTLVVE